MKKGKTMRKTIVVAMSAPSVQHFRFKEWDRAERLACVTNALDLWALY